VPARVIVQAPSTWAWAPPGPRPCPRPYSRPGSPSGSAPDPAPGWPPAFDPSIDPATGQAASMELALVTGRGPELVTDLEAAARCCVTSTWWWSGSAPGRGPHPMSLWCHRGTVGGAG
jgi:hypothetical protein